MFAFPLRLSPSDKYSDALQLAGYPLRTTEEDHSEPDRPHRTTFTATATQTKMLEWHNSITTNRNCLNQRLPAPAVVPVAVAVAVDTRENLNTAMDK
ncbi:uncharacterized protein DMAD_08048 [Drosophila madeirensis]|uniref:Uncharacterized protein n=1 Tax=Drosophila madeirensis TaxID=30013 RepID=A0AAU9F107_DROMD